MKENSPVKILLVDDRAENLFALEVILSSGNYLCMRANSGKEALKILRQEQDFAIILLDVQMPVMDGFETLEFIRKIESLKHTPVIFLTAGMDAEQVYKGYQAGAVDYIIKPFLPEILKAKVAVFVELYKKTNELIIADKELAFQNEEKGKRAAELIIANKELVFQNREKEKRADELMMANKELAYQNEEKEKRADELGIANKELAYQNEEKEKRAAELIIANKKLVFQNKEKGKRADELIIANKELTFQNREKEKRADELIIANKELVFQKVEKGKRAAELVIADKEIIIQTEEKEKQVAENKELEAFSYSVSHDLRAPLRHIGGFVDLLIKNNSAQLDEQGLRYLKIISESSIGMGNLIDALLSFSRFSRTELQQTKINSKNIVACVLKSFSNEIEGRNIEINVKDLPDAMGDESLINQVWVNLISNALKYSRKKEKAVIEIGGRIENDQTVFYIKDNGAGFDMKYIDKLFGVFQRLHKAKDFEGIGIGLANVNRIVVRHGGKCWAVGEVDKGATFFFSNPNH
jgi:signal transduction histidine kinase/CheY-like chemotaxis protein